MNESERFWSKVDIGGPDECWLWVAGKNNRGYGMFSVGGRSGGMVLAHRYSIATRMELTSDVHVLHSCDTPACVNPSHLSIGSHSENMRQMAIRLRSGVSKLTPAGVREARSLASAGIPKVEIARRLSVSASAIEFLLKGETWRHVS